MPDFGLLTFATDYAMQPAELARWAEDVGFESLFLAEHTHIPTSRRSPFGGGVPLPDYYKEAYDPFVALASAATATERIKLGTAICLVTEHNPITLAKTVATLDQISNGRVVLGIGAGWNAELHGGYAQELGISRSAGQVNSTNLSEAAGLAADSPLTGFSAARDGYFNPYIGQGSNKAAVLDFNNSADANINALQGFILDNVVVPAADLNGVAAEYRYLRPSIERYPKGAELVELACEAGFQSAVFYELAPGNLMGCLVCER